MSVKVKVSPRIVGSIAKIYQSTSRIFMEYIDNSLDSAEKLYEKNGSSYPYKISIVIKIDPDKKTVLIQDNCVGMEKNNLLRIVENIGDSNKKNDFVTNGQFGFGIHSYAACAHMMEVSTLTKDSQTGNRIQVDRSAYTEDGEIPDPTVMKRAEFTYDSGTAVMLSNFDSDWWRDITSEDLKNEIERHFEQLLTRDNLEIKIIYGKEEQSCKAFNYDSFLGVNIEKEIKEIDERGKIVKLDAPIKIFLKITEDIIPNKRPIFVNKGRRIEEVQNVNSFRSKSKYRTSLWGHNNLTGFIEVGGFINPTLSRDGFSRNKNRQIIYDLILELEDEINEALKAINKRSDNANLDKLEDLLSNALSKLAKNDFMRFRTQLIQGEGDIKLAEAQQSDETWKKKKSGGGGTTQTQTKQLDEPTPIIRTEDENSVKASERKKTGFNVRFSDLAQKKADGTYLRSNFIEGDAIIIYKPHPDFQERVKRTYQGELKITERLISYLASEIAIQYKDKFFALRGKQPEVQAILNQRKESFIDLIEFSYQFERMLQPFVGKNLLTLESTDSE